MVAALTQTERELCELALHPTHAPDVMGDERDIRQ
jgi:hypothetical protein